MRYRELTDYIESKLGKMNFKILARAIKKYTEKYLIKCIDKFPEEKKRSNPSDKSAYLIAILRNDSTKQDVKNSRRTLIIDKDFEI